MHNCEILNIDCMDYMRSVPDKYFDLAIVDPPYFEGPNKPGFYRNGEHSSSMVPAGKYGELKHWAVPDENYFSELKRVSVNQIIWGANHFADKFNPRSSCWIVWDKDNRSSTFADAELAYASFKTAVRLFTYTWNGMHQGSYGGNKRRNEKRIHPTQKPVKLYQWLLEAYSKPGQKILDTHLGSGSSAIAAHYFGVGEFVGCELDNDYFNAAVKRIESETRQIDAFGFVGCSNVPM